MGIMHLTRSVPTRCPACREPNLQNWTNVILGRGNTMTCPQCGAMIVVQRPQRDEDWEEEEIVLGDYGEESEASVEVGASFARCPHCETVDKIIAHGGDEWCQECSLDPSDLDLPLEEVAFLWRKDSEIRRYMESGLLARTNRYVKFVTTHCGPHCVEEEACPQSISMLSKCYAEYRRDEDSEKKEGSVGKKSKKRKRWLAKMRAKKEGQKAILRCAGAGWYERNVKYRNETPNPQEHSHTEGGSGA